jgi:hypothetical protein
MSFPNSHKTVFVLDHGPHFAQPCHPVEFDVQRARGTGISSHQCLRIQDPVPFVTRDELVHFKYNIPYCTKTRFQKAGSDLGPRSGSESGKVIPESGINNLDREMETNSKIYK